MLGMLGIVIAIAALIALAWRRWSAVVCALVGTLIVGVMNGFGVWGTLTDHWLPAAGGWVSTFILMFLTAGLYAKLISDSGAATRIAYWILDRTGEKYIFPALIIITMILTYGGISGLILIFVFWPIALPIARKLNKPRYLFVASMYFAFLTGAYGGLPGTPQTANVAAAEILGVSSTAAPVLGIIATVVMLAADLWVISMLDKHAMKKGRTFEEGIGMDIAGRSAESCPAMWRALIPILVLLALFVILSNGYLGLPKMPSAAAVSTANVIASIVCVALNFKYYANNEEGAAEEKAGAHIKKSIIGGFQDGLGPAVAMFSMVAFTAVVAATPAFEYITGFIQGATDQPYFQSLIATQIYGLFAGSAGATATAVCNTFGTQWLAMPGVNPDALMRVIAISASGLSTVPYSAGLFAVMDVTGISMKEAWLPQLFGVIIPVLIASVLCASLATAGIA